MPDAFEIQVRDYLRPVEGSFSYESMVANHLDVDKYRPWAETINHYHLIKGADVFSSGCGSAGDLWVMQDMGAASITGIEVDETLAELARTRLRGAGNIKFDVSTYAGQDLPYDDAQFDIITSIHVIEHVADASAYLSELLRVLRPGGILFLDCPNRFYRVEQHTMLPYVHLLPHTLRDILLRLIARNPSPIGVSPFRDKCGALIGMKTPFAAQIMHFLKSMQNRFPHHTVDAYFHDYGSFRKPYGKSRLLNAQSIYRHASAFRLVVCRNTQHDVASEATRDACTC